MKAFVFDVFGTIYDISSVDDVCSKFVSEPKEFTKLWRSKQIEYTFLVSLMGRYLNFWNVTERALIYALKNYNLHLSGLERDDLMRAWINLKPYLEVEEALEAIVDKKKNLIVLSNGDYNMLHALLGNTGLKKYFNPILSADDVKIYKPSPKVYSLVTERMNVNPADVVLVSSNHFDVAGSKSFGFKACWVNRYMLLPNELNMTPDFEVNDLKEMIEKLL